MTCQQGHEPETMEVEANSDDEAMTSMMEKCKAHFADKHQDMTMTDEEMKKFITENWHKEEGMAM